MIQYLCEVCEVNLEAVDSKGRTPLHIAAEAGHMEVIKYLVTAKKLVSQ